MVGVDPLAVYRMEGGRITGRAQPFAGMLRTYAFLDGAMFDLIGKLTGKAAWRLIGDSARDRVETYDGTLYFSDVWFRDRGVKAVVEEAEEAMKGGYRGIKLKLGRGWKWMDPKPDSGAMSRWFMRCAKPWARTCGSWWTSIMAIRRNRNVRGACCRRRPRTTSTGSKSHSRNRWVYTRNCARRCRRRGSRTLIADGENVRQSSELAAYIEPKVLVDVLQMDIRTCGLLENAALARRAGPLGAVCIPHNWGSQWEA